MSNREVIEQVYDAFHRLDLDGVLQLADPDVVIEQADALPWGGRYVGHAGITEFVTKLVGEIDSKVTTNELFEAGDKVVQVGRTTGVVRSTQAPWDVPEVHVWTLRGGKVVAADFYIDTPAALTALSSRPAS